MADQHFIDQIPDFLDGLLSEEEQAAFTTRLQEDPALQKEVELHRQVITSLGKADRLHFRQKLEAISQRVSPDPSPQHQTTGRALPLRRLLAIAAAVLVLILAGIWFYYPSQAGPQELLAQELTNFDPADVLPPEYGAFRNTGELISVPDSLLHRGRVLFRQKEYALALAAMEEIDPASVRDPDHFLYEKGVLFWLNQQTESAISTLQQINDPDLANSRHWFLALSHLQAGRIDECRSNLRQVVARSGPWSREAKALLDEL